MGVTRDEPETVAVLRDALRRDALELPSLPDSAARLLRSDGTGAEAAALASGDAELADALIRRAAARAAGAGASPGLEEAISQLGSPLVRETCIAASLRRGPFQSAHYADLMRRLWRRSLASSLFARELATRLQLPAETAFATALLWRVGDALLLGALATASAGGRAPDELAAAHATEALGNAFNREAARRWPLPDPVATAIDPEREARGPARDARRLARFARVLADPGSDPGPEWLREHDTAAALGLGANDLDALRSLGDRIRAECEAIP